MGRLENITIATRGQRTVHVVADQWEVGGESGVRGREDLGCGEGLMR
jgi:hypothetical protein